MCKGCGSCAGYCPSGAAQVKHFRQTQVFNEIDGMLDPLPDLLLPAADVSATTTHAPA